MASRKDILDQALSCVNGERDEQYGNPENNFDIIAQFWMEYLMTCGAVSTDVPVYIRAEDVAAMLALLKISRIATGQPKMDNWVDLAGYAACGGEIQTTKVDESKATVTLHERFSKGKG